MGVATLHGRLKVDFQDIDVDGSSDHLWLNDVVVEIGITSAGVDFREVTSLTLS